MNSNSLSNKIFPDFFSTFFMFPFSIHPEVDLSEYAKSLEDNGFKEEDYQITHGIDYNEYVYFYPYVWDILFTKSGDKVDGTKGVTFLKYKNIKKESYFIVNAASSKTHKNKEKSKKDEEIKLPLKNIFVHLFEVGVGILIFEIVYDGRRRDKSESYSLSEYLRFMETGRRIFIPFINAESSLKPGITLEEIINEKEEKRDEKEEKIEKNEWANNGIIDADNALQKKIMTSKVQIQLGAEIKGYDFLKEPFLIEKGGNYKPALSKTIISFLDTCNYSYKNGAYKPIIDDRMFVHSYFSIADSYTYIEKTSDSKEQEKLLPSYNHHFLEVLKMAFNNGIDNQDINEALELWYQMIFLDWQGPSCTNPLMMKNLLKDSTYSRWSGYGGFSGYSRFSSVMISNIKDAGYIYNHFQSMYYQIAILLLFYRGAILNFSERSEKLSNRIHDLPLREGANKDTKAKLKEIRLETDQLHREFLLFRNKFWFREVTAQDQGIEIFDLWSKQMRNLELMQDVQTEIKELFDFVDSTYEKDVSKTINILTVLGAVAIPLAIVTSFFGMNLSFISEFLENDLKLGVQTVLKKVLTAFSLEKTLEYSFSFLIFAVLFFVLYWVTHKIYDHFSEQENFVFPNFLELVSALFIRKKS